MHGNPTLEPDCSVCMDPAAAGTRRVWGCDEEAPEPVFATTCPRCAGNRFVALGIPCGLCASSDDAEPTGDRPIRRCPNRSISPQVSLLAREFARVYQHGTYPDGRGPSDQPAAWDALCRHYCAERSRIDQEIRDERMKGKDGSR